MLKRWLPWQYLITFAARRYNVTDPLTLMARLRRFAQPSEVQEPIELLRAGFLFHARGLVNTKAIQHNLDWIWPYWVEKQFDPHDPSFIPRAFSFSHINLTHRNWTAVGHNDLPQYPIVDPRGLVTPFFDGWSLDAWLVTRDGQALFPSQLVTVTQELLLDPQPMVVTQCQQDRLSLSGTLWVEKKEEHHQMVWQVKAQAPAGTTLICSLRPYNPEGIQFIEDITFDEAHNRLLINEEESISCSSPPSRLLFANYSQGDVSQKLQNRSDTIRSIHCEVGMATAALVFEQAAGQQELGFTITANLEVTPAAQGSTQNKPGEQRWEKTQEKLALLEIPDQRLGFLYKAAVNTLGLLSAGEVVPGPYTYKRFWFRDACLMLHAMLCLGMEERVAAGIESFFSRQKKSGYFRSQEGEWDSNGQVLWLMERFLQLSARPLPAHWRKPVFRGARWIERKRIHQTDALHKGLLPPGFSAEHFGPNDYYYWDDFWGAAGLQAAAAMAQRAGKKKAAQAFARQGATFLDAIWQSIEAIPRERSQHALPASPYRRLDAGAIGCLVTDYPLRQVPADDQWIANTRTFLMNHCFVGGAFFQDMIHSGINAYLTLSIAQSLLRSGDPSYRDLLLRVAELASPTGQWPEAIHPATGGGCMGDGQHGWAAAEWVMMLRTMFVLEEPDRLLFGAGIFPEWMASNTILRFGPTPTAWGPVTFSVHPQGEEINCKLEADWQTEPPPLEVRIPGYQRFSIQQSGQLYPLIRETS